MTASAIGDELREVVARALGVAAGELDAKVETLGSLERMELAVAVEDHFRVRLTAADEARLFTLDDVIALVEEKVAAGPAEGGEPMPGAKWDEAQT